MEPFEGNWTELFERIDEETGALLRATARALARTEADCFGLRYAEEHDEWRALAAFDRALFVCVNPSLPRCLLGLIEEVVNFGKCGRCGLRTGLATDANIFGPNEEEPRCYRRYVRSSEDFVTDCELASLN